MFKHLPGLALDKVRAAAWLTALALLAVLAAPIAHAQGTMVRLYTTLGPIDVRMKDTEVPTTVNNFLSYVRSGAYDGTFIHRNVPGFVVQGGGYRLVNGSAPHIPTQAPIVLEYSNARPNIRGSISMARTSELNSATSEFFLNLVDNTTNLGASNGGGYAVFGQMTLPSLPQMDAISARPNINAGGAFSTLPTVSTVTGGVIRDENLVLIQSAVVLPTPANDSDRVLDYLETLYWSFLKPPGSVSATAVANGVTYYYRYYPTTQSYVGVSLPGNVVFYLVPSVGPDITRFAPLSEVLPAAAAAGY